MKIVFYMNCVSAHQLPLAKEVAKLVGAENFCYVDAGERGQEYQAVEVSRYQGFRGLKVARLHGGGGEKWLETADVMLTGMRDLELFERRSKKGLKTYYTSERWFKPIELGVGGRCRCRAVVPGFLRMIVPRYRRMAKRFVTWANEDPGARVLAIGPWARQDFIRLGIRSDKLIPWGYFVAPSTSHHPSRQTSTPLKILWCGRMLDWKRVDTIIRAGAVVQSRELMAAGGIRLTLVGDGPEKERLMRLAEGVGERCRCTVGFSFHLSLPMEKVRELMRAHDLFVFPSNGYEGWGAVVSEALEEGMRVLASYECGAGATLLPQERLFHSGDWRALAQLIEKDVRGELPACSIGAWTAKSAARRLVEGWKS